MGWSERQTGFFGCWSGHIDADTREWTDGVLTAAARAVAKEPLEQRSWVVCDGDVDPEWIESLNSVLDDNRQDISIAGSMKNKGSSVIAAMSVAII